MHSSHKGTIETNIEAPPPKTDNNLVSFDQLPLQVQARIKYVRTKRYWVVPLLFGIMMMFFFCAQSILAQRIDTTGRILNWNYTLNNGTSLDDANVYQNNDQILAKMARIFEYTYLQPNTHSPTPGLRYIISYGLFVIIFLLNGWFYTSSVIWTHLMRAQIRRRNQIEGQPIVAATPRELRARQIAHRMYYCFGRIFHVLGVFMALHMLIALLFDCINGTSGIQLYLSAMNTSEYAMIESTYSCNITQFTPMQQQVLGRYNFVDCASSMFYAVASVALVSGFMICISVVYVGTITVQNIRERAIMTKVLS